LRRLVVLLSFCTLATTPDSLLAQTPAPTAAEVISSVRQATGGSTWDQFAECDSSGTIAFQEIQGKSGTYHYSENLLTGASVLRVELPERGVNQAVGIDPDGSWRQEDSTTNGPASLFVMPQRRAPASAIVSMSSSVISPLPENWQERWKESTHSYSSMLARKSRRVMKRPRNPPRLRA